MHNSAISKNKHNTLANHVSSPNHITRQQNIQTQSFSKNQQIPNTSQQQKITDLFKKFRNSAQLKLPQQNSKSKAHKKISFSQQHNSPLQSPLLSKMQRQETCFEPNSSHIKDHIGNVKQGRLNTNYIHDSSQSFNHSANSFKDQSYHQNNQTHINRNLHNIKPRNNDSFDFGHGLQGIDLDAKGQQENWSPQQITGLFGGSKNVKSFEHRSSTFTPIPSNITVSKKIPSRVSEAEMRSTGKNFFKRPLSLTASQDFFKTLISESHKGGKNQGANMNSSISPFRENQARGMGQVKRPLSQARNTKNSLSAITQILANERNRSKEGIHLSLPNGLSRLVFKYNGGHATTLYNYRLKIKNESASRLSIKIKCTSPRSYEVRPSTETILNPFEILNVSIELKLFVHDLNQTAMKHDLSRYRGDKFKIIYWLTDNVTQEDNFIGEKVLPVVIDQTEEQKARSIGVQQNIQNERIRQQSEEKEIEIYKKLIEKNKLKMEEVNTKIQLINSQEFKDKYFSKHVFWFFGLVGIGLGFWLS